jgi:signal transduction histidine kinase
MIRDKPLKAEPVRLQEVWRSAVSAVQHYPEVTIEEHGLAELPELRGDPHQLRQVFVNLLENAVQAVGDVGKVELRARVLPGVVELIIEDSGPGVSEAIRRRLFEPLITTKSRGIGLGLPLVKRILERHSGSISYAPRPEGGTGARFIIRLPTRP